MTVMHFHKQIQYAPLFIWTLRLIAPRKLSEAQIFQKQYQRYEDIKAIPHNPKFYAHTNTPPKYRTVSEESIFILQRQDCLVAPCAT